MKARYLLIAAGAVATSAAFFFVGTEYAAPDGVENADEQEAAQTKAQLAWYRWYFSEYAAALRLAQYGEPTLEINRLLQAHGDEFIPIEEVTAGLVCPAESNGAYTSDFIYFAARTLPLAGDDGLSVYAMSYLGSAGFAHSGKAFDALLTESDLRRDHTVVDAPFGLAADWLSENSWRDFSFGEFNDYGHSALMSYNAGDIDGDGKADFIFERWLVLSSKGYSRAAAAPRRAVFQDGAVISIEGEDLVRQTWDGTSLVTRATIPLHTSAHPNTPHIVLPLPSGRVAVRTEGTLDIYSVIEDELAFFGTLSGLSPGETQTGAFGDFDGDGAEDFWLSQVATPTPYPDKRDQLVMIRSRDLEPGINQLADVAWFTIRGSARYSDYDGIATTLSPRAGDISGDGHPDISFTGHRHMNESGALYILSGTDIVPGQMIDITSPSVMKVLGRPMSQMAPPFHHWDATDLTGDGYDDVVMPVDNDLCAGLNAGAIYVLDGMAIAQRWAERNEKP